MSSKKVTDVIVENCTITVKYSDCTVISYDISGCSDTTPDNETPGDSPDPFPQPDVRCRVAVHMAEQIVTNRYIDFLNAATPAAAASFGLGMAAVVSAKLAAWAWSATLYPSLWGFGMDVNFGSDRGDILTEYDADPQAVLDIVAEALYCVLPESGAISNEVRNLLRDSLNVISGVTYTRLAEFLGIYPLERLRDEAFEASITTDEVDCSAFDCAGTPGACEGESVQYIWRDQTTDDFGWVAVTGSTSQFPGFGTVIGGDKALAVERTMRGFETVYITSGQQAKPAAIKLEFEEPYQLCNVTIPSRGLASDSPSDTTLWFSNTRVLGVYIREAGSPTWALIAPIEVRGIGNTSEFVLRWAGFLEIDAIAIIVATGGRVSNIYQAGLNNA